MIVPAHAVGITAHTVTAGNMIREQKGKTDVIFVVHKLDSYSIAKCFFITRLHAHFRFLGHERLSYRSVSKCYQFNFKSVSLFYWSSDNALHDHFVPERWL